MKIKEKPSQVQAAVSYMWGLTVPRVSMYQNCLEKSREHVWDSACDRCDYMETRLY